MTLIETYQNILYFLNLTLITEVLWLVIPLFISTIIILVYFSKYNEEKPGWNSLVANSLVLLFVSLALFRYIYNITDLGAINFIEFPGKSIVALIVLLAGITILFLNFSHFLPEKIAEYISSPLTINLLAYIATLFVFSGIQTESRIFLAPESESGISIFLALLIIFLVLFFILNLIKKFLEKLFLKLKRIKDREKVKDIVDKKKPIEEKKKEIKKEEKFIRKEKKEVKKEEKQIVKQTIKEADKQKKEAIKLKKVVKK